MRWVIAGGGTGGHLFPALALARRVLESGGAVLMVGCGRRVEELALEGAPFPVATVRGEGVLGRHPLARVRALLALLRGMFQALSLIRRFAADIVFGTGGYSSVPVLFAGSLLRRRLGLHEQNAVPGLANRLCARLVHRVFVSFPGTERYFPRRRVLLSGNPVREEILAPRPREHSGRGLLVLGGSQGARSLNRLLVDTAGELLSRFPDLYLLHQTGERDEGWVREAYRRKGLSVEVRAFIRDMAWAYAQADLVVSRAGATTVAELCALGKPALYIPFPHATHAHQEKNARAVVEAGGGIVLREGEFSPAEFVARVTELLGDEERLRHMGERARRLFRPQAAETILREMEALAHA